MEWRLRNYFPEITDEISSSLRLFHVELLRFNQKINLISTYTDKDSDILHFCDSIKAARFIVGDQPNLKEIYDFGSGNGFPGIVLAILYPEIRVNLVEADERKAEFLNHISERAELSNLSVLNIQPDDINIIGPAIVVSRGMANLARTLIVGIKVLEEGSVLYTLKGSDWFSEFTALPPQISSTWNNEMAFEYKLPEGMGDRFVIKSVKKS
jgi:16S rRNA (guanine527-N7)-methyltransferase